MATRIPPIRPSMTFTDRMGRVTFEAYQLLFGIYQRIGGSLDSLNAATLLDKTWASPAAIGNTTPSTGKFTNLEADTLNITGSVNANSRGIKHRRVTTGSVAASSSVAVAITWVTPFPNINYTVSASVQNSTAASASLRIVHIEDQTANGVVVRVENTATTAQTGTIHVIAIHD